MLRLNVIRDTLASLRRTGMYVYMNELDRLKKFPLPGFYCLTISKFAIYKNKPGFNDNNSDQGTGRGIFKGEGIFLLFR